MMFWIEKEISNIHSTYMSSSELQSVTLVVFLNNDIAITEQQC